MNASNHFLLKAKHVVSMDEKASLFSPGYVEIEGGTIKSTGSTEDKVFSVETIDYGDAAIIPGLINSHNHAAMCLFRGIADDLPLDEWLSGHIWPLEAKHLSPEFIRAGVRLAAVEMLKSGTTFFSDMYFFEHEAARAAKDAGIRIQLGEGLLAFPTPSAKNPEDTFKNIKEQYEKYRDDSLVHLSIACHSTYATTEDQLHRAAELASLWNLPVQIHCAETEKEAQESIAKRGKSQVAYLSEIGLLDTRIGLVHMVWPQEGDLDLLKKDNIGVVLCPQSNLKLASGIPPFGLYLKKGIRMSLGTDSAASNNNLDIWEEMRLAALLAKGSSLDPTSLSAKEALRTVTIDAARTWGIEAELGSIEVGKKADLVVVDLSRPHNTPSYDVYSTLVYAAGGSDVRDVYVEGRRVLKDGKVTGLDEAEVLKEARCWSKKIRDSRANV